MLFSRSRLLAVLGVAALAATSLTAQKAPTQGSAAVPSNTFAVRCGTLLVGDGSAPLHNVWLIVRDGKIESVGPAAPASDLPVVDARGKVVMPGIVAVDGDLAVASDSEYQVTPDAFAIDAFDFERSWRRALEGGITSSYLSPGRQRLVSGQGAVVKLAGTDIVARVLSEVASLRVNFGEGALRAPRVFEPSAHPTDDDPLVPSRIQTPTSRISMLAELRAIFAAATDKNEGPGGDGPVEHQYDEKALRDVIGGTLPMRAGATSTHDIRRALQLQKELGIQMVLEDPREIGPVAKMAADQKVMATFRVPAMFGKSMPGGEDRLSTVTKLHLDAPAKAAAAGVIVGLSPAAGVPLRDYLMSVAIAVRHGLSKETAMRAVGIDAARILGVDDRVGSLEKGKDADFVVLSGEPLAIGSMVESTWIDGKRRFTRKTDSQVLAIRVNRVHDGTGRVLRNGVILMQNGRIKAVGEELTIPYGAEVIDLTDGVATPGFVDVFSHLGLAGEGTGVPAGNPGQRLHEIIQADDPMFEPALREGITSLLVAGKDGGLSSGRLAAIKTGAEDREGLVLRAIAGQRMVHNAYGPDAIKPLAAQIARGRKYVDSWAKYDSALYEWKNGKAAAPKPAPKPKPEAEKESEEAKVDPLTGTWEAEITVAERFQLQIKLNLTLKGTKVTGTISIGRGGREGGPPPQEVTGTFVKDLLKIEFSGVGSDASLEATVSGDTMTGELNLGPMGSQDVTGTRTSKTAGAAPQRRASRTKKKEGEEGKPKAPKLDQNLEPMRAVLAGKASLVVRANRAPAIKDVVALLEKEKISYVLAGCDDLLDDQSLLGGHKPPIIVGPEVVVEDDGELVNVAATFADYGMPIVFGSGNCQGTQFLPLHAAYAVRYGLSPQDALQALTLWPAQAFHLDDRIGSLEKGKDADLVVFSGNPFESTSRVLLVVCNGRVVVDNREEVQ
ncbi:MAG: imidazolonepropionase-like amidohydrolase [Planctomycetota bacterium]|jgi:imidazolonepropionase-like amidohydrolase